MIIVNVLLKKLLAIETENFRFLSNTEQNY